MSYWNNSENWSNSLNSGISGAYTGYSMGGGAYGALAGGAIGAVAGLFGSNKSTDWNKKYFNESVRQFNIQDKYNKNRLQYTVQDALKAGVNPTVAISGGSGHYSPTISAGGGSEQGSGGFNIADIMRQAEQAYLEHKEDRRYAKASAELDLESKRIENQIKRQQLASITQPGIASSGTASKNPVAQVQDLMIPFRTPDGRIVYRINQDAVPDTDITNVSTWQTVGDDPGSISSWLREVILPRKGSWNDRYLPGYAWGRKIIQGFIR